MSDESFENLVNEYGGQVLGTAMRVLHDANLAHDVHQEVFLAIWRRWHRFNGNVNWPAYLYRATVRKALEMVRRRAVRSTGILPVRGAPNASFRVWRPSSMGVPPMSTRDIHGQDARVTHGRDAHATATPGGVTTNGPDEALQADELQQRLAAALARLPRRQADAFVLSRLEGLSTAEIAAHLGCSESTVRVHLHRAVLRLARELHEYLEP